jgi:hypothetical protein
MDQSMKNFGIIVAAIVTGGIALFALWIIVPRAIYATHMMGVPCKTTQQMVRGKFGGANFDRGDGFLSHSHRRRKAG